MSKSTPHEKKVPLRRCTGCGESFPKQELCRVVRSPEGNVFIDKTGKANGRGAYICKKVSCFRKAKKQGRFSTNLGVTVPDEVIASLEAEISAFEEQTNGKT